MGFIKNLVFAFLSLLILAGRDEATSTYDLDMSLPWSPQEFHTENAKHFANTIFEASGGQLNITVHPSGVLGLKGPESIRALSEGIVDIADMPAFQQVGTAPLLGMESLPFLVRDQADLRLLYSFLRPKIEAIYKAQGLRILYIVPWPNQNIYLRAPADNLSDLANIRIRTYDRNTSQLMTRLGLNPVQMPAGDVVPALASGLVDAAMTSTTTGAAQRYWEFLNYIYRTNHVWISNIMAVSEDSLSRLPEDLRQLLLETAANMEADFWAVSAADDAVKLNTLIDNGIIEVVPNAQMLADMQAAAQPMWEEFVNAVGPDARDVLDNYLKAREVRQ